MLVRELLWLSARRMLACLEEAVKYHSSQAAAKAAAVHCRPAQVYRLLVRVALCRSRLAAAVVLPAMAQPCA